MRFIIVYVLSTSEYANIVNLRITSFLVFLKFITITSSREITFFSSIFQFVFALAIKNLEKIKSNTHEVYWKKVVRLNAYNAYTVT